MSIKKKMNEKELAEVLKKHALWLKGDTSGKCANLRGADLSGVYLHGANLRGADLHDADLSDADLSGADLHDADLSGADLCGASLFDADLSGALLCGADLFCADLRSANLFCADLRGANLFCADLRDADLRVHCADEACWRIIEAHWALFIANAKAEAWNEQERQD